MQIQLSNESDAIHVAKTAGFGSVEEYVKCMIKQAADLEAIREGLADVGVHGHLYEQGGYREVVAERFLNVGTAEICTSGFLA